MTQTQVSKSTFMSNVTNFFIFNSLKKQQIISWLEAGVIVIGYIYIARQIAIRFDGIRYLIKMYVTLTCAYFNEK